jgi:hypothetical protein
MIFDELVSDKALIKCGDGDSSGGSESAPSDDNLDAAELIKNLPDVDKSLKKKIKLVKEKEKREKEREEKEKNLATKTVKKEPPKRLASPVKKIEQTQVKGVQVIKPEAKLTLPADKPPKKPKPEMKDAITQTDRSDY